MNFYNIKDKNQSVNFKDALFNGIAKDGGLYLPDEIPVFNSDFIKNLSSLSFNEINFEISKKFLSGSIPLNSLQTIIEKAINFDAPLVHLNDNIHILELFHGPTFAFKDFGARFMAEIFQYFISEEKRNSEIIVLVATSGDTGSAVANAFYKKEGIKVVLLYPENKISRLQEKQLTTLGENIFALEINGTFDDCQSLVKTAFNDQQLKIAKNLTSANSINISRLLPQIFYYFRAYQQLEENGRNLIFSVPSGNLGNLTAGLIAYKMGLPVSKFVSATNKNSVFTEFIKTGNFHPEISVSTLSNAMDVGNPSNFFRIEELFKKNYSEIKKIIVSKSISDDETLTTIKEVYQNFGYIMDPHGAVGYKASIDLLKKNNSQNIILETAHPAKFSEVVKKSINLDIKIPDELKNCMEKEKISFKMQPDFNDLKEFLISI